MLEKCKNIIFFLLTMCVLFATVYYGGVTIGGHFGIYCFVCAAFLCTVPLAFRGGQLQQWFLPQHMAVYVFCFYLIISAIFSVYSFKTQYSVLSVLPYVFVYLIVAIIFDKKMITMMLRLIIFLAATVGIFGLLAYVLKRYDLLWCTKHFYLDRLTATFIYPSHYACYVNLILPLVVYSYFVTTRIKQRLYYGFVFIILFMSLVFSFSYSGFIIFFVGMLWIGYVALFRLRLRPKLSKLQFLFIVILAAVLLLLSGYSLYLCIDSFDNWKMVSYSARCTLLKGAGSYVNALFNADMLRLFFGVGLGCFVFIFNQYYPLFSLRHFEHAHNDFLELGVELGLVGIIMFMLVLFFLGYQVRNKCRSKFKDSFFYVCLSSSLLMFSCHMALGFNFDVGANMLIVSLLAGAVNSKSDEIKCNHVNKHIAYIGIGLIMVTCVVGWILFATMVWSHQNIQKGIVSSQSGKWEEAEVFFDVAERAAPQNADVYRYRAEMLLMRAVNELQPLYRQELLSEAVRNLQAAIVINPLNALYYVRMADVECEMCNYYVAEEMYRKAISLMPKMFVPRWKLIHLYLNDEVRQYNKAYEELNRIMLDLHRYVFQNNKEKQEILRLVYQSLERIPSSPSIENLKEKVLSEINSRNFP